ncbi:MAG TPA: ATP-binding protein [Gemmatimonadaceae bacterium]|jgi:anti-sigma regulatory factor (Ser/Thr protein kinase)|nr:ATP-binding protein [Gemmatimonadaceae bacterium]
MSVGAHADGVGKLNAAFAGFAEAHALPDAVRRSVNVALDELLANKLSHGMADRDAGSAKVEVQVQLDEERLTVTITDDGPGFDPFGQAEPDTTLSVEEREIGGLGIHLVRKLMDEVSYERRDGKNVVVLVKQLVVAEEKNLREES